MLSIESECPQEANILKSVHIMTQTDCLWIKEWYLRCHEQTRHMCDLLVHAHHKLHKMPYLHQSLECMNMNLGWVYLELNYKPTQVNIGKKMI